jgi:transcriptional regulator with PAS, ATPase and Fis domain
MFYEKGTGAELKKNPRLDPFKMKKTLNEETWMNSNDWLKEFPGAVTVCDKDGVILSMNAKAVQTFAADGGAALVGKNVFDCHPEPARAKLRGMMEAGRQNVYTIEKQGVKKLIYQSPWTVNGQYRGFVELSLEIPFELPHFLR